MSNHTAAQPAATEVLIVGGGPAGLAVAIALRQRGIDCTVVEARAPGIDKACGEGLMPDSRESLSQLGISLDSSDGQPFRGIRFRNSAHSVDATFRQDLGIGVRRPRLHALLADRARQTGAHLLWNSRVQFPDDSDEIPEHVLGLPSGAKSPSDFAALAAGLKSRPIKALPYRIATVNGQPLRFRWLVGADGQASSVRKAAGLDRARTRSLRYAFRTHYRIDPATSHFDSVEIHWGRTGQLYLTPVAPDCVCAVYITRDARRIAASARTSFLDEFPAVVLHLGAAEPVSAQRGAVTASRKLHRVATRSVALIGDASGSADAITGEGLAISFRQALALAESIQSGSLAPYARAHRKIGRLPIAMGELMLMLDRWPALQARAIRALADKPIFFDELLQAHMGERNLASVLLRRGPGFGWNLFGNGATT